jgi:hypothetical protein
MQKFVWGNQQHQRCKDKDVDAVELYALKEIEIMLQ